MLPHIPCQVPNFIALERMFSEDGVEDGEGVADLVDRARRGNDEPRRGRFSSGRNGGGLQEVSDLATGREEKVARIKKDLPCHWS